jgi:scyllo-inositol 2-dehydrogenase (NADP+)
MIRFGIIGTGKITEEFVKSIALTEDIDLAAVYSRSEERANEFAKSNGIKKIFTNLREMAESSLIDAVYIASPNSLHAEQAILFMKHGKHVLCEKPVASNKKELMRMIEASRENSVLLMEAMKSTFLPNFKAIKENLHKIGRVRRYFANYCQYSSRYDLYKSGKNPNTFNPEFSSGSLMDLGCYCIYPAVALFGRPLEVRGNGVKLESGVDGEGSILLKFEEMDGVIMYSKISHSSLPNEIQGENGNIIIDKISIPSEVKIVYRNGEIEDITRPQIVDSMYYEIKEFVELIKNNKLESDINSHDLSFAVMEIMDEARRQMGVVYPADK